MSKSKMKWDPLNQELYPDPRAKTKNQNAVALGRLGGKPGVKNPRKARSHEQAKAAVMVRWNKQHKQQNTNTL